MAKTRTTVRNHIRRLRFESGEMTQQALADRIRVTRQTVNAIEGEKYSPTIGNSRAPLHHAKPLAPSSTGRLPPRDKRMTAPAGRFHVKGARTEGRDQGQMWCGHERRVC